jgi:glyoxylase-like metal-dependent hydrolase (beta-lactamase superfamily II)
LRSLKVCALLLVCALAADAADGKYVNERYDLVKVADGVYSFIAPENESGVVQGNCTLIIGEEAVLVVDSGQFPSLAERMVADIKKLTPKPVRFLVNTHWHFDHVWGNATFRDAFPGLTIISTEFTREMVEEQGPKVLARQPAINKQQADDLRKMVADGKFPGGRPMPEEWKPKLTYTADTLEHINADLARTVNVPPTVGFKKELTINLGKREIKVMWLGRANTGGDAIIWVPDVKLLATGDTVVYPIPFPFGSYFSEWIPVLEKMMAMNAAIYIPGHGPVMHDAAYLKLLVDLFQALITQVKQCVSEGLGLEDTMKKVNLDAFPPRFVGSDDLRQRSFRATFIRPAIDRAYQEATGKMKAEADE